jgi:hypothetical protein
MNKKHWGGPSLFYSKSPLTIHLAFFVLCIGQWTVGLDWSNPPKTGLARWLFKAWRVTVFLPWVLSFHLNLMGFNLCLSRNRGLPIGVRSDPEPKI